MTNTNKVKVRGAKIPFTVVSYPKTRTKVKVTYSSAPAPCEMNLIHNDVNLAIFVDASTNTVFQIKRGDKRWVLLVDEIEIEREYTQTAVGFGVNLLLNIKDDKSPVICAEDVTYKDSFEIREIQAGDILLVDCCNVDCNEELKVKYVTNNVAFCEIEFFTNDDLSNRATGYCAVPLNAGYKFDVLITTAEEGAIHFERYEQLKFNRYTDGELVMAQAFDRANK